MAMTIEPLPEAVSADLATRRRWVYQQLAARGADAPPDAAELADHLTRGIAWIAAGSSPAGPLAPADRGLWICLGVVLGDVFCLDNPGASWVQVTDEYGTDPVVQLLPGQQLIVGAPTMLAKRVEEGEPVDADTLAALRANVVRTARDTTVGPVDSA